MPWSREKRLAYFRRERAKIIAALGGQCIACWGTDHLEIDHPNGREYVISKLSPWQRLKKWREELARGELRLLCRECNATDGGGKRYETMEVSNLP